MAKGKTDTSTTSSSSSREPPPPTAEDKAAMRLVKLRAACGLAGACVIVGGLWVAAPFPRPQQADVGERMGYAVRWLLPVPLLLLWTLHGVGSVRARTKARDPLNTAHQDLLQLPKNMIQNTIEQGLLHSFGTLMLSTYLTPAQLPIIPGLAINFAIGRMLFYWGYQSSDNLQRAYGFAMNFFPNIFVLLFIIYKFATEMLCSS